MNPWIGWTLALFAVVGGTLRFGWQGALAATAIVVFWMLLQFSRVLRVMRAAVDAPVGHVESAVMLDSRLRRGQRLVQVVQLTRSLGRRLDDASDRQLERWRWTDAGGDAVELVLRGGRLAEWRLLREDPAPRVESQSP